MGFAGPARARFVWPTLWARCTKWKPSDAIVAAIQDQVFFGTLEKYTAEVRQLG